MAAIARLNCEPYPAVSIVESDFEHWAGGGDRFRLIYCAQAWHWVAPEARYSRARELLEAGGALAVFFTGPRWQDTDMYEPLLAAYRDAAPEFAPTGPMHPANEVKRLRPWWLEFGTADGFQQPEERHYDWTHAYSAAEYVALLQTHSDHIVLGDEDREPLLAAVEAAIERHGGTVAFAYRTSLYLARAEEA